MEALGSKLRRQRRRLGLTLDDLADRTGISKPYLSLIETGRVSNPPSDEKLRRLEQALAFPAGELISQAHLHRTPRDVRAVLARLMRGQNGQAMASHGNSTHSPSAKGSGAPVSRGAGKTPRADHDCLDLDDAFLSGVLAELVDQHRGNIEPITTGLVPIINKVAAGYPRDFTDLSYPRGIADEYLSCPEVNDSDAFAARVHGDSMSPKYAEGDIVVFSPAAPAKDGDDCFVRFEDGQTTFKRVFFETDDSNRAVIRLQPRNERYRPQVVPRERINGLYKAVYRYQRLNDDD
ncbi:MAG: XRE family transcriptional regulator [Phycisphaerae bacterium]|nr:XRE family transcriptional regulator [Phycisphaerae bacterium]MDW8261947.1 XRE family transcriptional regulator [Phycisphaerales bacterium]